MNNSPPALDPKAFRDGMTLLSGAFDWDGTAPEQIAARQESYWHVLKGFDTAVWAAVVEYVIQTRKPTTDRYGRLVKPGFPYAAELVELSRAVRAQQTPRLAAPEVEPAPPDVAHAAIAAIKERIRQARGPLAADLRMVTDDLAAPDLDPPTEAPRLRVVR